jgi:hypothetical protein
MYCKCFEKKEYCGAECGCVGCNNIVGEEHNIKLARDDILMRNPYAFEPKVVSQEAFGVSLHRKGCKCKNSQCKNNYCECY